MRVAGGEDTVQDSNLESERVWEAQSPLYP